MDFTSNAQATAWAAFRDAYRATGYVMPADHRHSPGMVIGIGELWLPYDREYVTVVSRFFPDGHKEAVTDVFSAAHFAADARNEGRRI